MGVSWADGSPRGANLNLLDPEYLRWREEQDRPTLANSPISMAVERRDRELKENRLREEPTNYMVDYRFRGSPSAQSGRREGQNEMKRPPVRPHRPVRVHGSRAAERSSSGDDATGPSE
jgi:hypothetical protein